MKNTIRTTNIAGERLNGKTDWAAFDAITEEEALANALADPDARPAAGREMQLRAQDGGTLLERFRKALEREKFGNRAP